MGNRKCVVGSYDKGSRQSVVYRFGKGIDTHSYLLFMEKGIRFLWCADVARGIDGLWCADVARRIGSLGCTDLERE
jgi:hypothetical protein